MDCSLVWQAAGSTDVSVDLFYSKDISRYLPRSSSSHFVNQSLSKNVKFINCVRILCLKDTNASFSLSELKHLQDAVNNKGLHNSSAKTFNDLFKLSVVRLYYSLVKSNVLRLSRKITLPVDLGDFERRNYRNQIKVTKKVVTLSLSPVKQFCGYLDDPSFPQNLSRLNK
jgi:uncharacterized protein YaaR (DUF327 family)